MNLQLNCLTRVLTPDKEPAKVLFSDLKVRVDKKLRSVIMNTTDLVKLSNATGEIAFDIGSLHMLLEKTDVDHKYVKTPTNEKRWEDDPIWTINPAKYGSNTDPLGQRATISFMGKTIASLNDETGEIKLWNK